MLCQLPKTGSWVLTVCTETTEAWDWLREFSSETTTPPTAVAMKQARAEGLQNFTVYCNHVLTPPALRAILD